MAHASSQQKCTAHSAAAALAHMSACVSLNSTLPLRSLLLFYEHEHDML